MNIKESKELLKYSDKLEKLVDEIKELEKFLRALKKSLVNEKVKFNFYCRWGGYLSASVSAKFCREKLNAILQEELGDLKKKLKNYPQPPYIKPIKG